MGTMTHLVWRQLIKEKARTFTTILAMAVAATLTVATLIGINSARHSMYQDNIQNTGGLQFVLSKVNQETALAIQKKPIFPKVSAISDKDKSALLIRYLTNQIRLC